MRYGLGITSSRQRCEASFCRGYGRLASYSRMNGRCHIFVGYTASARDSEKYGSSLRECNIDHLVTAVEGMSSRSCCAQERLTTGLSQEALALSD